MRAIDVITECDTLKPNIYSFIQKRKWLDKVETDIRLFASRYSGKEAELGFLDDENPTLFLNESNSCIYTYFLISMIDLSNQEFGLYNNSSSFYNASLLRWQKEYRRTHRPKCDISIKV